ncbi:hypothetical protein BS78_10G108100, partial [Paspalum vaginatum]
RGPASPSRAALRLATSLPPGSGCSSNPAAAPPLGSTSGGVRSASAGRATPGSPPPPAPRSRSRRCSSVTLWSSPLMETNASNSTMSCRGSPTTATSSLTPAPTSPAPSASSPTCRHPGRAPAPARMRASSTFSPALLLEQPRLSPSTQPMASRWRHTIASCACPPAAPPDAASSGRLWPLPPHPPPSHRRVATRR